MTWEVNPEPPLDYPKRGAVSWLNTRIALHW
jgi:hypothetical protein